MSDNRIGQMGKATLQTTAGALDAYASVSIQGVKADHAWDGEEVKDFGGYDIAWLARNQHITISVSIKLTGASKAAAIANGAFLLANARVTLSGFDCPWLNTAGVAAAGIGQIYTGSWQYYKGGSIDLQNERTAGMELPLRKYQDPTQNTLSTTAAA